MSDPVIIQRPSEWIMARAREKAEREREGETDLIKAGIIVDHRHPTIEEHVKARSGWFVGEATLEWIDDFHRDMRVAMGAIGRHQGKLIDAVENITKILDKIT